MSESQQAPVLAVDAVDFMRQGRAILDAVSLTVHAGEHWALIGANGAGKSTLLSMCGALAHPTRGTVEVLGRRLGRVDLRELRGFIGHVDPRHQARPTLTVREVVLTGATGTSDTMLRWQPSAAEAARAAELVDLLGMRSRADAAWHTLSQGERGRTLIARALMPDPHLLLLDEPSTGLDIAAREHLLDRIDGLRRQHPDLSSVLVTHHLEELPTSTTHAMLLREGRVVAQGPADAVLTSTLVSETLDYPVSISRTEGRWAVRTRRPER
ncbi:ATP-binding cassette domain-containing protein [Microbacterium sp. STN6]|uniref:ABC transporter ATP-binding protein n=1 Tax=Microbacterium sp. STN6 TaxID=2995588 RepID=UPI002260E4A0|nr:ATP-binding cassette domain-containing protein [Microbacterium sp. STN6]MCX7522692.1 ATP-binding cassette domain-containing protein [Microbacterium sp. STN6]